MKFIVLFARVETETDSPTNSRTFIYATIVLTTAMHSVCYTTVTSMEEGHSQGQPYLLGPP